MAAMSKSAEQDGFDPVDEEYIVHLSNNVPIRKEIAMNSSYNYADFIGLNLDPDAVAKTPHHVIHDDKPPEKDCPVKSSSLTDTPTRPQVTR